MGKKKFFKCPKCSRLLQIDIELPEDNKSWPYVINYKHMGPGNVECEIAIAVDSNYTIREIGKEGLGESKDIVSEQVTEDKNAADLGFKVIRDS